MQIKFKRLSIILSSLLIPTLLLSSCANATYYKLPLNISGNTIDIYPGVATTNDLSSQNYPSGSAKSINYLPKHYQYNPNEQVSNYIAYATYNSYDNSTYAPNYKTNWMWDFIPFTTNIETTDPSTNEKKYESKVIDYSNQNINIAISSTGSSGKFIKEYTNIILNFICQASIETGKYAIDWLNALFGQRFGGGFSYGDKNSQQINDWFAFCLSNNQLLSEGKYTYGFDAFNVALNFESSKYGFGPFIDDSQMTNFVNPLDNEYLDVTNEKTIANQIANGETPDNETYAFSAIPQIVNSNSIEYSYYDYKNNQGINVNKWLVNDLKKVQNSIATSSSWKSNKIKSIVGKGVNANSISYKIELQRNNLPTLPQLSTSTNSLLNYFTNITPNKFVNFTNYSFSDLIPYPSSSVATYPSLLFYKISDTVTDFNNLTFNDLVFDDSLLDSPDSTSTMNKQEATISTIKLSEKLEKYFTNFYQKKGIITNEQPFDLRKDETLSDRVYSLLFCQTLLGSYDASNNPCLTQSSDFLKTI